MKNKNKRIDITLIILFVITIILTLLILSAKTSAEQIQKFSNIAGSGDLTQWINYNPIEFLNKSVDDIFALNKIRVKRWSSCNKFL